MTVRIDLFSFWKEKEKELQRKITVSEVSKATGLSRNTISSYLKPDNIDRPDNTVVNKLCQFFNVPAGPVPFLIYKPD